MISQLEEFSSKMEKLKIPALSASVAILHDRLSGLIDMIRQIHTNHGHFKRLKKTKFT